MTVVGAGRRRHQNEAGGRFPTASAAVQLALGLTVRQDNINDMWAKGRETKRKLSKLDVLDIRGSKERSAVLAKRYGVHATTIRRIRSGRMWKSLSA